MIIITELISFVVELMSNCCKIVEVVDVEYMFLNDSKSSRQLLTFDLAVGRAIDGASFGLYTARE